ncbi:MAG: hypothetical protein WC627_03110 [Legionella sp.]|jgi:hypothetical protein
MIIGTYWCDTEAYWLRFNQEGNKVHAEVALPLKDNQALAGAWQTVEEGQWITNYAQNNPAPNKKAFRILDGVLYATEGKKNALTQLDVIEVLDAQGDWRPFRKTDPKAAPIFTLEPTFELQPLIMRSYETLPLTVEAAAVKWQEVQKINIRQQILAREFTTFTPEQNQTLYENLQNEFDLLDPKEYESATAYLNALEDVVTNPEHRMYQALLRESARTDFDNMYQLNTDNANNVLRETYARKIAFYLHFILEEINFIRKYFGLANFAQSIVYPANLDVPVPPAPRVNEPQAVQEEEDEIIDDDYNEDENLVPPLQPYTLEADEQLALRLYLEQVAQQENQRTPIIANNPVGNRNVEQAPQVPAGVELRPQQIVIPPFTSPRSNEGSRHSFFEEQLEPLLQSEPEHEPIDPRLKSIKDAVNKAQDQYQLWYDTKTDIGLRGHDGFFSRWQFRHGEYGQTRAKAIMSSVADCNSVEKAQVVINDFLDAWNTRYNRHSFASFLVDELEKIPNDFGRQTFPKPSY